MTLYTLKGFVPKETSFIDRGLNFFPICILERVIGGEEVAVEGTDFVHTSIDRLKKDPTYQRLLPELIKWPRDTLYQSYNGRIFIASSNHQLPEPDLRHYLLRVA